MNYNYRHAEQPSIFTPDEIELIERPLPPDEENYDTSTVEIRLKNRHLNYLARVAELKQTDMIQLCREIIEVWVVEQRQKER